MTYRDFGFDFEAAYKRIQGLGEFQLLHNELGKDFLELYRVTIASIEAGNKSPELIRSCIREFFSLVEADLFYLNYLEPYDGYDDGHAILDKFKKTYKAHCKFHDKMDLYRKFLDHNFSDFRVLKFKRDKITHPKNKEGITVDRDLLDKTYKLSIAYTSFVNEAMRDTGVKFQANNLMDGFNMFNRD